MTEEEFRALKPGDRIRCVGGGKVFTVRSEASGGGYWLDCEVYAGDPWSWERAPEATVPDPVTRPAHYTSGGIEVIDAIEAWGLNYHRGNVVKYVARAGKKDPAREVEDLRKARWYIDREIERLTKGGKP